jgi:hypothetical protein
LPGYSSTLEIEVTYSSKVAVDFQWTALHYIPVDITVHNHTVVRTLNPTVLGELTLSDLDTDSIIKYKSKKEISGQGYKLV